MEVTSDSERAVAAAEDGAGAAAVRHAGDADYTRHNEVDQWAGKLDVGKPRFAPRAQVAARPVAPGHRRQPRRLHPVHALPARLPRRAGERRDRPGLPRRARQDRVRHGRPDGRLHLRGLRRMRAGLPDRRADAGARRRAAGAGQAGRFGLPVLRRRLPAHLQRQGQQDPLRRRPRRPGQPRPPVRQGPLRLRLRAPPAAPDRAADPPRRRAQARRLHDGPGHASWTCSAKRPGKKRWHWPAASSARSATRTARSALAGFGSAKGSNEEAYLFQKLVRTGFGSNNVDHCTRLCHASSVAALLEGIGSGAVSNPVMDVTKAEVVIVIGANPTVNHPVAATWIKNAVAQRHQADRDGPAPVGPGAPAPTATCSSSPTPTSRCSTR